MSDQRRRPPQSARTARERVQARRTARRAYGGRRLVIPLAILGVLAVAALTALIITNRTVGAIQETDPRLKLTAAPASTALPGTAAAATPVTPPVTLGIAAPANAAPLSTLREPFNILLLGVDKRSDPNEGVRSDTLILVRVNPQNRTVSMLSIPRDTIAPIPGVGQRKVNFAFSYGYTNAAAIYGDGTSPDAGGGALAAETVQALLNVPVDYVAQVDFRGFERLVDSIGGIVVDVNAPLLDPQYPTENYGVQRIFIPSGLQTMDGRTALIYARTRHSTSDFDRSRRQQIVLRALLTQVRGRGVLENAALLPKWADLLKENVRTTFPIGDLALANDMATFGRSLDSSRILTLSINPGDVGVTSESGSDIYWNSDDLATLMRRWLAGPTEGPQPTPDAVAGGGVNVDPAAAIPPTATVAAVVGESATIQVLNASARDGSASGVSTFLAARGYEMAEPEGMNITYPRTTIIDLTGRPKTRAALAALLRLPADLVQSEPGPNPPPARPGVDIVVIIGEDVRQEWLQP